MSRHRAGSDVTVILDASNTNPMCAGCDRRTAAIDATRVACRFCGEITTNVGRVITLLKRTFRATIVMEVLDHADRS